MFGIGMQEVLILGVLALLGLAVVAAVVVSASRTRSSAARERRDGD